VVKSHAPNMSCNVICCLYSLCIIKLFDANVMQIDDDEKITVIDFPQMVSVSHRNAQMYEASQITNVKVSCI
jgi:hypothetical protein